MNETTSARPAPAGGRLGELLRRARTARGLALEDAARALAVPVPVLAALEEERLDLFEAWVYLKGHAARYGAFLGCALEELEAALDETARRYILARPSSWAGRRTPPRRRTNRWVLLVSAAVLVLLAGGYLFTLGHRLLGSPPPAAAPASSRSRPALAAVPPLHARLPRPKPLVRPPRPLLVLTVHGTSWISVRDLATGTSLFRGLAPPPHHLRFFHPGRYRIVLGRARNVSILRDGRPWTPPPLPGGVQSERFTVVVGRPAATVPRGRG